MKENKGFLSILALNIIVFLLQARIPGLTEYLAADNNVLSIIGSMFAHASIPHIFFNMLFVAPFAIFYENEVGSAAFVFDWLLCGVGATLFDMTMPSLLGYQGGLGASGACSGIIALASLYFAKGNHVGNRIAALLGITGLFMINLLPGIMDCILPSGIGHMAHVGGILMGGLIFLFIQSKKKK